MERLKCAIRAKRSGDESMLFFLAEECLHPLAQGSGHADLFRPDELIDLLERANVFVAEAQGEVAGYVAVERDADSLAVRCLCVGPGFEGRAVSHQLVDWVEGVGYAEHARRLRALIPAADEPSRHLYREHDFVPAPSGDRPEMIVMEKRLTAD
jgi:N-acetylglutamate synthase-like GNAT family acetyltransferase